MPNPRASLREIAEAIETATDSMSMYLNRQTGKVVLVTEDDEAAARDESLGEQAPDWQRDSIVLARQIGEDTGDRFLPLPDKSDAHEWGMMERFTASIEREEAAARLHDAIHGNGAFRRFKDAVHSLGLAERWYSYKADSYRRLAVQWCQENGIEWESEDKSASPR